MIIRPLLLLICALLPPADVLAATAGRAQFVSGEVAVESASGARRPLKKGESIEEGDTVVTGQDGQAQLIMVDEAIVAVRPATRLHFEAYQYSARADGNESSVMALARGGFRTISGLIGKLKRNAYRIKTPTATIGIRGTDHEPLYIPAPGPGETPMGPPGTYNKVNSGETFIENASGRIELGPNQAGFAPISPSVAPVRLPRIPAFMQTPAVARDGDKRTQSGAQQNEQKGQQGQQSQEGKQGLQGQQGQQGQQSQQGQQQPVQQSGQQGTTGVSPQTQPAVSGSGTGGLQVPGSQMPPGGIPGAAVPGGMKIPGGMPVPGAVSPPLPPPIKGSFDPANPQPGQIPAANGYAVMGGDRSGTSVGSGAGVVGNDFAVMLDGAGRLVSVGSSNFSYVNSGAGLLQQGGTTVAGHPVNWGIYGGGQINDATGLRSPSHFHFMGSPHTTPAALLSSVISGPMTFTAAVANNEYTKPIAENGAVGGTVSLSITLNKVSSVPSVTAYNLNVADANSRTWAATLMGGAVGLGQFLSGSGAKLDVTCTGCAVAGGLGSAHGAPVGTTTVNGVISSYDLKAGAAGVTGSVLAR